MDLFKAIANFLLFFNVLDSGQEIPMKEKTTYYPTYAHQAIDILKAEVSKEYGVRCCGRGASMPYDILSLSVDFQTKKTSTIEEARDLIVNIMEKFRRIINEHRDIQPFLRESPFPSDRIHVTILFNQPFSKRDVSIQKQPQLVMCIRGNVCYCEKDESGNQYIDIFREPYEEALSIVRTRS